MAEVDFEDLKNSPYDSIGMNGAYKKFKEVDFWPTYYTCWDYTVTRSHAQAWTELIKDESCRIKKFFFLCQGDFPKDIWKNSRVQWRRRNDEFTYNKNGKVIGQNVNYPTSGACSIRLGVELGYTEFILLGADCNYVEKLPGAQRVGNKWVMGKTPESNPNYFFADYQEKGDAYNTPNCEGWHRPSWNEIAKQQKELGISVVNCSPKTSLTCFPKGNYKDHVL